MTTTDPTAPFRFPVVRWNDCEDGCIVNRGRRPGAAFATLVCGAATVVLAITLARSEPVLVLGVLCGAALAGAVFAVSLPRRRASTNPAFAAVLSGDPGPKVAREPDPSPLGPP